MTFKAMLKEHSKPVRMTIVLARIEIDKVPDGDWKRDLGHLPKLTEVRRAVAMVWLLSGVHEDAVKAEAFGSKMGYTVICYGTKEQDPLGRAKRDLLEGNLPK